MPAPADLEARGFQAFTSFGRRVEIMKLIQWAKSLSSGVWGKLEGESG